jgi:diguanylate cyclase (GGDEF)-like protein
VNIALGFILACYLGYGPPVFAAAVGSLQRFQPRFHFSFLRRGPKEPEISLEELAALKLPPLPEGLEELFDSDEVAELNIEPFDEPYDDDAGELMNPSVPELWDLNEKYVEASILQLNIAMMKSSARTTDIDCQLRECRGHSDRETIETCLRLLREDCVSYLAEQSEAAGKFRDRLGELGQELSILCEEIEMGNFEQAAQVETTLNNLEYMDFGADPEEGNRRLLEEIKNLGGARYRLRDKQEAAFLAIARCENRIDKIEKQLFTDPLTKLPNRIGLEVALHEWWKQRRHKTKSISAVLFDVDRFSLFNENHGPLLGDKVLYQIGQILKAGFGETDLFGRFAGQRFLAVLLDVGPRAALRNIELMRQTIEKTVFIHDEEQIKMTVGCAITEIKPDDTYIGVLERLEKTLKTVKEAGANRTFMHIGRDVERVESPSFGAESNEIVI